MTNKENLKDAIIHGFHDMAFIWIEEFKTLFRDKGAMIFLFLLPLGSHYLISRAGP